MARLIDADALIRSVCRKCNDVNYDDPCEPSDCALYSAIYNAPTVDAVPVVHGAWIDGRHFVNSRWKVCSVCHGTAPEPHGGYEYCPNCGAKMDLEVEEL